MAPVVNHGRRAACSLGLGPNRLAPPVRAPEALLAAVVARALVVRAPYGLEPRRARTRRPPARPFAAPAREQDRFRREGEGRGVMFFRWVFFLISPAHLHARPMGVHRTCRRAGEIELTPIGVVLSGSRRVRHGWRHVDGREGGDVDVPDEGSSITHGRRSIRFYFAPLATARPRTMYLIRQDKRAAKAQWRPVPFRLPPRTCDASHPHAGPVALSTCGEPNEIKKNKIPTRRTSPVYCTLTYPQSQPVGGGVSV